MGHHAARPIARSAVAAVAAVSLGMTAGCGDEADEGLERTTLEQVDPGSLEESAGEEVTVSGTVRQVISPDAFLVGGEGGEQPLLVVNAEPDHSIAEGATVRVTGVVHTALDLPAVEDELGRDLDDADLTGHGEAPYLVAEAVEHTS